MIPPDFRVEESLGGGVPERLLRARRRSDGRRVLLLTAPREAAERLARELEVSRQLGGETIRDGVVHAREILPLNGETVLVLEDPGGEPLDRILRPGPLPLEIGLTVASELAAILDLFHRLGLIHCDLRPSNLLVDLERRRVRLMGLGRSSEVPRERRAETGELEHAPAYMSPEQTGRINRLVDYRTDFYSFGVLLYEMLTGDLPFRATDALGWVHAHVARQPIPPEEVATEIPPSVSQIVLKLLAKTADDRYQGGEGLHADLERCLAQLREHGTIRPFSLGVDDLPARFELPQRLYGREKEMRRLVSALEDARGSPAVVLVKGPSGMGKSALIGELRQHVLGAGGHFAGGKYEELGRSQPLSGILEALRELVRRFLSADRETAAALGERLSQVLGTNLGVVVAVLPELVPLVGETPPVARLDPVDEQRRFHRSIAQFLRVFADEGHPLVLFLDDLQWADRSSLELLSGAVDPAVGSLLVLGACRDDWVDASDSLTATLATLRERGVAVDSLRLEPLGREALGELVGAALRCSPEHCETLAEAAFRHSGGSPYNLRSFLTSLHEKGLLSLVRHGTTGVSWRWDLDGIAELEGTSNAVRPTAETVSGLPAATRRLVALAATLGGRFATDDLAVVGETSPEVVGEHLLELCRAGLLVKCEGGYQFAHDRLRESAYALIPHDARAATHLRIGRLLAGRPGASHPTALFETVDHFNRALTALADPLERVEIARLNLAAGRQARAGAAFSAAHEYFGAGLALLSGDAWHERYGLALALHSEGAEAAYLVGDFAGAGRLVELVHRHSASLLDEIPAYEVEISIAMAEIRQDEALNTLAEVLSQLGVELPVEPRIEEVEPAVLAANRVLEDLLAQDPRRVKRMTDPARLAAMRLLNRVAILAYWSNQLLAWLAACKALELVVEHGHCVESALTCMFLGHMRCQLLDDVRGTDRVTSLGWALFERFEAERWKRLAQNTFYAGIESFRSHLASLIEPFSNAYRAGIENGDVLNAMLSALGHCLATFHSGAELSSMEALTRRYHDELERAGAGRATVSMARLRDTVLTLMGRGLEVETPVLVTDHAPRNLDSLDFPGGHAGHHFGFTYCHDILLHHLFRHSRHAFEVAVRAVELPEAASAGLLTSDYYLCLALLGGLSEVGREPRRHVLAVVESRLQRMRRRCRNAPMSYRHKIDLVEAERLRALGRRQEAVALYQAAAQGAREHRYVQHEALAFELAAELQLELERSSVAALYLAAAADAYGRWGARGKLDQLAARYPDLLARGREQVLSGEVRPNASLLDRASLERAAQALSQTLELDRLLRELMAIMLENAAAQRGFLLRSDEGELVVEACGSIDASIEVLGREPLDRRDDLCLSIVRYVHRSGETVVLGDAGRDDRFATDPDVVRRRPQSVLCLPILHQDRAVALVYLENNRIRDAFAADRVAAVQLIAAQAAVALENARLHEDLRRHNEELETKNAQLERFTYTASHDLKTPLVTIQGFVGLLEKDLASGDGDRVARDLEKIGQAAGKMGRLLDDLLELSRIGRVVGTPEAVPLGEVALEAVELLAAPIAERGIEVTVDPALPVVWGDRLRLGEVYQNLVENAVKYLGSQERPVIEIGFRGEDPGRSVFFVRDNGIGIAAPYLERVFGLFERLDASAEGTGIGLALVKRIVEVHGGRIWAESEGQGRGTSFYFTLEASQWQGAGRNPPPATPSGGGEETQR